MQDFEDAIRVIGDRLSYLSDENARLKTLLNYVYVANEKIVCQDFFGRNWFDARDEVVNK